MPGQRIIGGTRVSPMVRSKDIPIEGVAQATIGAALSPYSTVNSVGNETQETHS